MPLSPATRRIAVWLLKLTILSVVVWGGQRTLAAALDELRQHGWQLSQLRPQWAALAAALYLLSQVPSGWFWHGVLAGLGQRVTLPRALRAYFIGHLGKYVPGKAMVVVLRTALVGPPHVKTSMAVVAVFYETFMTMGCGAAVAAGVLVVEHSEKVWLIAGAFALALAMILPTVPAIFVRLLRVLRISRADPTAEALPNVSDADSVSQQIHLSGKMLIAGSFGIALGWFLAGGSLWATLRAIGVDNATFLTELPLCTATVALAVVAGFVSLLPAGFGVREIALLELLAPRLEQLDPQQGRMLALVTVVVLRLIWLLAEAALSAVLYPLGRTTASRR